MDSFQEGDWVILYQLNKKKLARIGRKGFVSLGKDFVSLEGAIGCPPWTNFRMEPQTGPKSGKRMFKVVPTEDDDGESDVLDAFDHNMSDATEEDRDNRTINDDGQSQSLSSIEIEALREGGLKGKEIVNHLVANSSTYDRKTRYAQSKYLRKKESKHCLREKIIIRKTTLSSVAEVLCGGGGGEGSRGSIIGMRPDTLSQMLTALNVQWNKIPATKQVPSAVSSKNNHKATGESDHKNESSRASSDSDPPHSVDEVTNSECPVGVQNVIPQEVEERKLNVPSRNSELPSGTTYVVYESGNWGLVVASLLTLLPNNGPRLIHVYPGHGVPCLIAPRALNLPQENYSILSSVNFKALLEELGVPVCDNGDLVAGDLTREDVMKTNNSHEIGGDSNVTATPVDITLKKESDDKCDENIDFCEGQKEVHDNSLGVADDRCDEQSKKRKLQDHEESEGASAMKKPRWQVEAEFAAGVLTSCKADGLVVVACREHPVSIVLSLLPFLAPSRPVVVYCPYREPLQDLYAVLKGWEPWTTRYGRCGGKDGVPRVANLRVTESWLRCYQVLPNRTHPEINMTPGGGFILTGVVVDFNDD